MIADHVGQEHSEEMQGMVRALKEGCPKMPKKPDKPAQGEEADPFAQIKHKQQFAEQAMKFEKHEQDEAAVFLLVMGQCDPAMKNKVKALPEHANPETK